MDFGKVPAYKLDEIDFSLPENHSDTDIILNGLKSLNKKPELFIGCAKWGRKEWIGKIYPPSAKEKDFVNYYVRQFNTIELNATHYRIPSESTVEKWKLNADENFRFCPKFPQWISHIKRLKNCESETINFIDSVKRFGINLGTCFLQLPPDFSPTKSEILENYINSLPNNLSFCIEFRHEDWFRESDEVNYIFRALNNKGIGTVITDTAGRRDCVHMRLTSGFAFIRFVGNSLHESDFRRINNWAERIKKWLCSGLRTVYFMIHMHDEKDSPELTLYAIRQFNKICKLNLREPVFYG
ncbi:MAG: DUF72 domain-containing protein [Ignavibacteria bacterium]|nr:DUF72 domain-containing protein [Ignavibacteria bacterium]